MEGRPRQGADKRRQPGRLRALGRAADRRVDREAGQGPRSGSRGGAGGRPRPPERGGARHRSLRAGAGVLPLGVRHRRRGRDHRHQPVRPAERAGGEGPDEQGAGRGRAAARRRRAEPRGAPRGAPRRRTTSASRRSSTPRARPSSSRSSSRAGETGCVVTHGLGPRYLHSTGQLHKGGPPEGRFVQVVDDPGDELAIPDRPSASAS